MVMQQIVFAVRSWAILYLSTTVGIQWQANVFAHLIRLPVQYFEKRHLGDLVSRFASTEIIQRTLTTSFLEAILDGVMTIVALLIMFLYSPMLSIIAVFAMMLYILVRCAWYRPLRNASEEQIIHAAKQESHLLETMRGVKAIKLFLRQEERRSAWLALMVDQVNAQVRTTRLQVVYRLINGLLFGFENILIIWLGASLVMDGKFSVGILTAFISYKAQFASRVSALIDKFFEVKMLQLQGERLADIVLAEPELTKGTSGCLGKIVDAPSITVRGVQFRYTEQEPYVLADVNFHIPSGASVAIVGPSGCGKTTLLNMLLGILPVKEGEILVGDAPLATLGVDHFRSIVGTVLQDDVLFAGSIADNISFFDPFPNHEWMAKCAELAAIADDISGLPMGYNTLIGDMGTVLSGGQKQRVLLARALYKRPQILFLDEATSHLDVERERQVNKAIQSLKITRVIIAHRPETIASVERVIVLHCGRVAYDGAQVAQPMKDHENSINIACNI
jgi:ATP-binding cassette subfamily B protein RaxB